MEIGIGREENKKSDTRSVYLLDNKRSSVIRKNRNSDWFYEKRYRMLGVRRFIMNINLQCVLMVKGDFGWGFRLIE